MFAKVILSDFDGNASSISLTRELSVFGLLSRSNSVKTIVVAVVSEPASLRNVSLWTPSREALSQHEENHFLSNVRLRKQDRVCIACIY